MAQRVKKCPVCNSKNIAVGDVANVRGVGFVLAITCADCGFRIEVPIFGQGPGDAYAYAMGLDFWNSIHRKRVNNNG